MRLARASDAQLESATRPALPSTDELASRMAARMKAAAPTMATEVAEGVAAAQAQAGHDLALQLASAELHFVSSVAHRPLGDQVARYLSLHFLEETLRGETPESVPESRDLQQAIHRIAQPSVETRLSQKRLAKDDREDIT